MHATIRAVAVAAVLSGATGCSSYRGTARDTSAAQLAREPGWVLIENVPFVAQEGETECGAAAIGMMIAYWTGDDARAIRDGFRPVPATGLAAGVLRDRARERGLAAYVIEGKLDDLARELRGGRPVLVGLRKPQTRDRALDHFEVLVGVHQDRQLVVTLDPAHGWRQNSVTGFFREWKLGGHVTLVMSKPPAALPTSDRSSPAGTRDRGARAPGVASRAR